MGLVFRDHVANAIVYQLHFLVGTGKFPYTFFTRSHEDLTIKFCHILKAFHVN